MLPELPWGAVFQGAVRVLLVVMLKGNCQIAHCRGYVRLGHEGYIIALDRLHEALGHAVALGTAHRRGHRFQAELLSERPCFSCDIG